VLATGAHGVAVVRALLSADDPAGEAQALRRLLLG
jgi:thiamine monophosphate synthase